MLQFLMPKATRVRNIESIGRIFIFIAKVQIKCQPACPKDGQFKKHFILIEFIPSDVHHLNKQSKHQIHDTTNFKVLLNQQKGCIS